MTATEFNEFLARHGWTGYQFAALSGIPKSSVYKYLQTGVTRPDHETLIRLANKNPKLLAAK